MGILVRNPMFAEMQREKNKALAEHNWRGAQLAARILLGVVYLFILGILLYWIDMVRPYYLMYVLLGLETVMIPAALHGTIAGDREKRSLDMLLVAPLTAGQIVVGKFSRGFVTIMGIALAVGIPTFVVQLVKLGDMPAGYAVEPRNELVGFFLTFLYCVTAGMAMGALTMWISSKTRTNSAAMLSTIGALFLVIIVAPAIANVLEPMAPTLSEFIIQVNPFVGLESVYTGSGLSGITQFDSQFYMIVSMVLYLCSTVLFLTLATGNVYALSKGRVS